MEAGDGTEATPACQVRGLGAGLDGSHGVSHPQQNLFSVRRNELQLRQIAAVFAPGILKDIDVNVFRAKGVPSDGEGTSLGSSRVDAWLDGVFLDRDCGKTNLAFTSSSCYRWSNPSRRGIVVVNSFQFQTIDFPHKERCSQVFVEPADNAIVGKASGARIVNPVARHEFPREQLVGDNVKRRMVGMVSAVLVVATAHDGRQSIDGFRSGIIEGPRTSQTGSGCIIILCIVFGMAR